jgi:hypothetical protein
MNKSDAGYLPPAVSRSQTPSTSEEDGVMSEVRQARLGILGILGIDVAKTKFDAALLCEGKLVQCTCSMDPTGFTELSSWIRKHGIEQVHACLEATGEYGAALGLSARSL